MICSRPSRPGKTFNARDFLEFLCCKQPFRYSSKSTSAGARFTGRKSQKFHIRASKMEPENPRQVEKTLPTLRVKTLLWRWYFLIGTAQRRPHESLKLTLRTDGCFWSQVWKSTRILLRSKRYISQEPRSTLFVLWVSTSSSSFSQNCSAVVNPEQQIHKRFDVCTEGVRIRNFSSDSAPVALWGAVNLYALVKLSTHPKKAE